MISTEAIAPATIKTMNNMEQGVQSSNAPTSTLHDSLSYWADFIQRCLTQRLSTDRFDAYVRLVYENHPLPPHIVADLLLRPQPSNHDSLDPRIPPYLQALKDAGYVDTPSVLKAMYRYSSSHVQARVEGDSSEKKLRWRSSYWTEEVTFYRMTKSVVEGRAVTSSATALEVAKIISKWMALFTAASSTFAADGMLNGQMPAESQIQQEMEGARAAFVALLLRLCENVALINAIEKPSAKEARRALSTSLGDFVPTLQLVPQITEKLDQFRTETLASADPVERKKQAASATMSEMLDSAVGLDGFIVQELPITNTRAGLYVYINALLVGRPLLDDNAFFGYLGIRYQGDVQTAAIDLILASFDVLANAVFRNGGKDDAHLLRSYLINKVPLLLHQLCPPEFSAISAEFCVTEALKAVDRSLFPTASAMFDESRSSNPYTESVREEFCAACVLHGLVDKGRLDSILGEISMGYEPTKYNKDKLVSNCLSDSDKIQGLVRELEKMDGNVGAVCQAIVELIRQLCNMKETMSLKLLCSQLVQKPPSLDVLLLFERPTTVLEPLCQLLDKWHYDEDQAEYQPVYEEFGAILLLVLAFAYRYNLSPADMGIYSATSSVGKIISQAHSHRDVEDLTEAENGHVGGWVHGLFDVEAGGLGDDLMSSCPPQEFYILVAPLFYNIVVGYAHGHLTEDTLKSGFEYLVDTFLLPSLVPAIRFLADHLWVDQKEQKAALKVLQLILLPSQISGEAIQMLNSVKNLVAKPLEHALRTYQKRDPQNQDVTPLLNAIKDSLPVSRRTAAAELNELETWCSSQPFGFTSAVKTTIQGLVQWSIQNGSNIMPTPYTHRQILAAIDILGARRVLTTILDEVKFQTDAGNGSMAYDVATALICAPNVKREPPPPASAVDEEGNVRPPQGPAQQTLSLRDLLRLDAEDSRKIQKSDPNLAEHIVRLHRRVEAQLSLPQVQATQADLLQPADMSLGLDTVTAEAAAAATLGDVMAVNVADMDMDMSAMPDLGGPVDGGSGSGGGENLFGDLSTELDDFDWDAEMDLS